MFNELEKLQQKQSSEKISKEDYGLIDFDSLNFIVQYLDSKNAFINLTKVKNALRYYDVDMIYENNDEDLDALLKKFPAWKKNLKLHTIHFFEEQKDFKPECEFASLIKKLVANTYHLIQYNKLCEYLYNCNRTEAKWVIKILTKDVDDKTKELLLLIKNENTGNTNQPTDEAGH